MQPDPLSPETPEKAPPAPPRVPLRRQPPPPLADKLRRGLWQLTWLLLARASPVPLHGWRRVLLRLFGAHVGAHVAVYPSARVYAPWNLKLCDGATVGGGATLYSVDEIRLGARSVVSQGAHLCTASHDIRAPSFDLVTAPIVLEDEAWVAAEAFLAPGVKLGTGAVVAARAVVTRPVAERDIVAGNPAQCIGRRPEQGSTVLEGRGR